VFAGVFGSAARYALASRKGRLNFYPVDQRLARNANRNDFVTFKEGAKNSGLPPGKWPRIFIRDAHSHHRR
jgi:hypothetical protein